MKKNLENDPRPLNREHTRVPLGATAAAGGWLKKLLKFGIGTGVSMVGTGVGGSVGGSAAAASRRDVSWVFPSFLL